MGKRTKDLFSLLEEREQGKTSGGSGEARRRGPEPAAKNWWASVRAMFAPPPATGGRRARATPGVPGLLIAAVAVACLGVGYGLGRWLPRAEAGNQGLVAKSDVGKPEVQPRRPGRLEATPGQLSPEKEAEILSNQFIILLQFAAPQAEEAARVAAYLRAQDVESARVRKFQVKADKTDIWAVLAYVVDDDVAGTLARLKAVPPSRTWPQLATRLQQQLKVETYDPAGG